MSKMFFSGEMTRSGSCVCGKTRNSCGIGTFNKWLELHRKVDKTCPLYGQKADKNTLETFVKPLPGAVPNNFTGMISYFLLLFTEL